MKTEIFKKYAKFAFDVIEEVRNEFNPYDLCDEADNPYCAFLHEELLNTFVKQEKENYKILELQRVKLTDP